MFARILQWGAITALTITGAASAQQSAGTGTPTLNSRLTGNLNPTHDPVIAREGDTYYVFSTGGRYIVSRTSKDLVNWTIGKPLIDKLPDWAIKAVPGVKDMWRRHIQGQWPLSPLLLPLHFWIEPLCHRPVHQPYARPQCAELRLARRRPGGDVDEGKRL